MNPVVRTIEEADLNEVVQLHIKSFPDFFLTRLGKKFLHELYKDFFLDDSTIFKIVQHEGHIKGFVIGTLNPDELFKKMLFQNGHKFLFFAVKGLIKNPLFVSRKLLYALQYRGERPEKTKNAALLSSIGVDPEFAKNGYGTILIKAFCEEAFTKNADAVYLTTDLTRNDPVNNFYVKNGFQIESTFEKSKGRMMNRYIKFRDEKNI